MSQLRHSLIIKETVVKPIELLLNGEADSDIEAGRIKDPLEVFVGRLSQDEKTESYKSRKIEKTDGLLYYLSQKPGEVEFKTTNEKLENRLRLLCCVTVYNESHEELFMTLQGIFENMDFFLDQGISTYDVAVCVVFDGILKLNETMINYFRSLDSEMSSQGISIDSKIEEIKRGSEVYLKEAGADKIKFNTRKKEIDNKNYLPPEVPKKTSVCYQVQLTNADFKFNYKLNHKINLNVFFNVKITNKGKLSSHLWFFQGFCKFLQPQYCALIDCGTKPAKNGLFNFFRVLEADDKVGGLCGYMGVRYEKKPAPVVANVRRSAKQKIIDFIRVIRKLTLEGVLNKIESIFDIQKAQEFEYCFAHIFDKAFESTFGFIAVLPGAWSAYRWDALSEDNLLEREYLQTVLDPNFQPQSLKQANKLLAEDRLLCLAIFTKRNKDYVLKYVPDAEANTDLLDTIQGLILQRKRWINGTWYALDYVLQYQNQIRFSSHSEWRKMLFHMLLTYSKLGMISTYFLMAAFLITYRILMFEFFRKNRSIDDDSASLAGFFFYLFIGLLEFLIFLCLLFKPNEKGITIVFRLLAHLLGILSLFSFILLLVLLGKEVFGDPTGYFGNQNLMRILSIANVACYLLIALINPSRIWTLVRCAVDYIYYTPTYLHVMIIYAFCRIDDLSWGTKGADSSEHSGNEQKFYLEKVEFVGGWILANALVTYIVTVLISSVDNKYYFMTALITFTTGLLIIKTVFAIIYQIIFVNWIDKSSIASAFEQKRRFYREQTRQINQYMNDVVQEAGNPNNQERENDYGRSNVPPNNYAEFLGSLFFIVAVFFTALFHEGDALATSVGVGIGLFIAITAFGKYTGGHFNPAVTTGYFFFIQSQKLAHVHTYLTLLFAQFLGGLAAGLLLSLVSYDRPVLLPPKDNILGAFIDEIFFSFMFMTVIYCIKSSKHNFTNDSMLGGLTVGITLSGCVLYGGKVSGACYNPAIGFALNFWATITRSDTSYMRYLFIYLSGPTLGSLIAGFLVRFYIDSAFTPHVEPLPPRPENMPFLYDRSKTVELVTKK